MHYTIAIHTHSHKHTYIRHAILTHDQSFRAAVCDAHFSDRTIYLRVAILQAVCMHDKWKNVI